MEMTLPLYAGELITCENGHPIGRVARNGNAGKPQWVSCVDWSQYVPQEGGATTCLACGALWVLILSLIDDPDAKRGRIHVGDRWRPPLDEYDQRALDNHNKKQ